MPSRTPLPDTKAALDAVKQYCWLFKKMFMQKVQFSSVDFNDGKKKLHFS